MDLWREVNGSELGRGNPTRGKKTSSSWVVISSASLSFSSCVRVGTNSNQPGSWLLFPLNINLYTYDITRPWFLSVPLTLWFWLVLLLIIPWCQLTLLGPFSWHLLSLNVRCGVGSVEEIWSCWLHGLDNSHGLLFTKLRKHVSSPN